MVDLLPWLHLSACRSRDRATPPNRLTARAINTSCPTSCR
jgi:hypothetical protein